MLISHRFKPSPIQQQYKHLPHLVKEQNIRLKEELG